MRHPLLALALPALLALGFAAAVAAKEPEGRVAAAASDPLVVHEWGTFTSVQGADGVVLEGIQHEEEPLPSFVYSRAKVRDCPLRAVGYKGLEVPVEHVTQKMETPVLYFHTQTPRRLRVRVDLVRGLISQWYPVSDLLGPPEGPRDAGPLDLAKVERSFLQWDVDLLPQSGPAPQEIPAVAADDPWAFARRVDAAFVRTVPRTGPERRGPTEAEHYLFYRGLGAFSLPMTVEIDALGRASFANGSPHEVAQVVTIEVGPAGAKGGQVGRYAIESQIRPGERRGGDGGRSGLLDGRPLVPWQEGGVEGLRGDLAKILVSQGMNPDEAAAMISTWSRSWFSSEGLRVLYVVPRPLVDALLPLSIDPKPDAIERVLVGRIETIPPATQVGVERALVDLASRDGVARAAAKARLDRLGRFLEAHLRRVIATSKDAGARKAAEGLLAVTK